MKSPPVEDDDSAGDSKASEPPLDTDSGTMSPLMEAISAMPPLDMAATTANLFQSASESSDLASNFPHTFLMSILASIDSKDEVVATTWLETLLDVIDLLPKDVVKDKILALAEEKSSSPEITCRLAACRLIGKISSKFDVEILKTDVMRLVQNLCRDATGDVRTSICNQLPAIAHAVGLEATKTSLVPELERFCRDDIICVRLSGINTVVVMLPLLDQETRRDTIIPLMKTFCENAQKQEGAMLRLAAKLFGRICHGLHEDFDDDEKRQWFINFYNTIAQSGLPGTRKTELPMPDLLPNTGNGEHDCSCRQHCAYNLPAMILFSGGAIGYRAHLHDTLLSFLRDPWIAVRTTLAHSFHQICTLIGSEVGLVKEAFLEMLRSGSLDVLAALVPNIPHILACFHHRGVISSSSVESSLELFSALKQGEECISLCNNWRIHSEVLRQLAALALCLPPEMLFLEVVPLMLMRMHTVRPIPCRLAASRTLLVYLRHMEGLENGEHICNTLIAEFCGSSSCHKRMLFLNMCEMAMQLLTAAYFKEQFYHPLLSLYADQVPNIRLKLVKELVPMKSLLELPQDQQKLQELETTVGNLLLTENDRDVSAALTDVINQLDLVQLTEGRKSPDGQEDIEKCDSPAPSAESDGPPELPPPVTADIPSLDKDDALPERKKSPQPFRRQNSMTKASAYVAAQRRKSTSFPAEAPPDKKTVSRLSNLDPSDDEFLVDAGIRFNNSAERTGILPKLSSNPLSNERTKKGPSRLPQPSSKIPVKHRSFDAADEDPISSKSGFTRVRSKGKQRLPRPVSSFIKSPLKMAEDTNRSLSHENLHSSFARLGLTRSGQMPLTSPSKTGPVRASSCSSSPGTTRSASPVYEETRLRRGNSASTSPVSSRSGSPSLEELRAAYRQTSRYSSSSGLPRRKISKLPLPTSKN